MQRFSYQHIFAVIIRLHLTSSLCGLLLGLFTTYTLTGCHIKSFQADENGTRHKFMISSLPGSNPTINLDHKLQFTSTVVFYIIDVADILLTFLLVTAIYQRDLSLLYQWVLFSTIGLMCQLTPLPFLFNAFTEMILFWLHVAVYPFHAISVWFVNSYRIFVKKQNERWAGALDELDKESRRNRAIFQVQSRLQSRSFSV